VLLALLVVCAACQARVEAGPYLVMDSSGARVVKVQTKNKSLTLEYELPNKKIEIAAMQLVGRDFHEARLPEKALRYRVHVGESKTKWHELVPESKDGVQRIVAYGDPRVGRGNPIARDHIDERIVSEKPSLIIASGDLVAWGDQEGLWQDLFEGLEPIASRLPYVAAIGNHDVSDDQMFKRFLRAGDDKDYMSMPLGTGRLIILDSNELQECGNEQYVFLEKELATANRTWPLIVAFHHPPFNYGHHLPRQDLIEAWVPLFQKYAVDLVLLGHDHDYQRIGPIGGVQYIVTGGGGAPLVRGPSHTATHLKAFAETNHYVVLEIKKDGMTGIVKDEDGEVIDRFSISR